MAVNERIHRETDRARQLWVAGDHAAAIGSLRDAISKFPYEPSFREAMGTYCYNEGRLSEGLPHLQVAVQLRPTSEDPARCLYQTLLGLGQRVRARKEAKRFLRATNSTQLRIEWTRYVDELTADPD